MAKSLPPVNPDEVITVLRRAGFVERHRHGSHHFFVHPVSRRRTTVAEHKREVPIGTLRAILHQAGLTVKQFRELLYESKAA